MEQLFVNKNFRYARVIPVKNGCGWSLQALCRQVETFFKARNFNGDYVVVWIDRESRIETSAEMATALRQTLADAGFPADRIAVMVCDRMTENVILADETFVSEQFGKPNYAYTFEGRGGKHILAKMYQDQGIAYRETEHGVQCLKKIRLDRASAASPSVAAFREALPIDCWWFTPQVAAAGA
jgi:hypothetical protein